MQIPGAAGLRSIAAGAYHSAGTTASGGLTVWGTDFHGTLTSGVQDPAREPRHVDSVRLDSVAAGWKSCAGVGPHGRLITWGWSGAYAEVRPIPVKAEQLGLEKGRLLTVFRRYRWHRLDSCRAAFDPLANTIPTCGFHLRHAYLAREVVSTGPSRLSGQLVRC